MEEIKEKKVYKYSKEKIIEYNNRFRLKHQDIIITCPICDKQYNELNYYHLRSKHHLLAVKLLEKFKKDNQNEES